MRRIIRFSFVAFLVVFAIINPVASYAINESVQTVYFSSSLPNGTQIDIKLSEYYKVPVATGSNGTYWYVAQSWHTSKEIANLSSNIQMHGVPTSDYGAFSSSKISMPVSHLFIVIFIGIANYISRIVERFL